MLEVSLAGVAFLGLPNVLRATAGETMIPTPQQTAGPFYPLSYPDDSDNDLVHVKGHAEPAKGTVTRVAGRIFDRAGRPLSGARVEIWQCDANGRYHDPRDDNPAPEDLGFQGYGQTVTAADGGYRFRTIRPVPYPGRTAHIHFKIGGQGLDGLVTQLYVAGEPRNASDGVLDGVDVTARQRVIVPFPPAPEIENNALKAAFDIVLENAG